jgi:cobalamin biosynthesis protein CobT
LTVRGAWTLAAGAAALVAAGCGGESRLSQEDFQKEGNAICAKYDKQIEEIGTPTSVEEVPAYVNKVLPIVERQVEDMKELNPPEEDQQAFDAMIAEAEKTVEAGRDLGEAAEANDDAAVEKALNEGNAASDRADEHATDLGLTDCVDQGQ